ncbi:MAG: CBS domain-containing protein [Ahniella sp.]|nr:CBS domain-containing protein [Ahniella sp.]
MTSNSDRLLSIADQIKKGVAGPSETVRTILSWFGAERRGHWVVKTINDALDKHNLITEPDFESTWIDGTVTFASRQSRLPEQILFDPTFRLGRLEAANKEVVSVKPNDTLDRVIALMLTNDFSQLPVMTGPRDVKGMVSWKTIGSRLALGKHCAQSKDFMETAQVLSDDVSLLDAAQVISNFDYVLVQKSDKVISGLVTAFDFSIQFKNMSEPFLLIEEIEHGIRHLLHGKFSDKELQAVCFVADPERKVAGPSDLTFGEYVRLIESDANWKRIGLQIDRVEFVKKLDRIRGIRNDVMHFDPDGIGPGNKRILLEFAQFLNRLREICK